MTELDPATIYALYKRLEALVKSGPFKALITGNRLPIATGGTIVIDLPTTTVKSRLGSTVRASPRYKELWLRAAARCSSDAIECIVAKYNVNSGMSRKSPSDAILSERKRAQIGALDHGRASPRAPSYQVSVNDDLDLRLSPFVNEAGDIVTPTFTVSPLRVVRY